MKAIRNTAFPSVQLTVTVVNCWPHISRLLTAAPPDTTSGGVLAVQVPQTSGLLNARYLQLADRRKLWGVAVSVLCGTSSCACTGGRAAAQMWFVATLSANAVPLSRSEQGLVVNRSSAGRAPTLSAGNCEASSSSGCSSRPLGELTEQSRRGRPKSSRSTGGCPSSLPEKPT